MTRSLSILHLFLKINETGMPYNEFALASASQHDVTICSFFPSDIQPAKTLTTFVGDGSVSGFFRALEEALAARRYDILHFHSPHMALLFLIANRFSLKHQPPTLLTVHNAYPNFKPRNRLLLLPVFRFFDRIVPCSQASADSFPSFFRRLGGARIYPIPNGVDLDRIDAILPRIDSASSVERGFSIVSVGRLIPIKNPQVTLTAFGQIYGSTDKLIFIGQGSEHDRLAQYTNQHGLDANVQLAGLIPRTDVFRYMKQATLFVSPSKGEGLPIAVMEAMSCCCPVILSDIAPHREIAQGVDFIPLIAPTDVAGFAREIQRFQAMDASQRRAIGEACRQLVQEKFSLTRMHEQYMTLYKELMPAN